MKHHTTLTCGFTYQNAIHCTWLAATLCVAQSGHSSVETQTIGQHVFNELRADGLELRVVGAFGNNDDGLALPNVPMLRAVG